MIGLYHSKPGNQQSTHNKPLIRWAGGKRLISQKLLTLIPRKFGTYFEPMIGSGALFFALRPKEAMLGDINSELINFYQVIKTAPEDFHRQTSRLRASKKTFYRLRTSNPLSPLSRAVRFFYLIRLSWNGLYRVNKQGKFNVPFGERRPQELVGLAEIRAASHALRHAQFMSGDFQTSTTLAKSGDFVFFDPPYPKGAIANNGFARYHETGFTLEDHAHLSRHARTLSEKGVYVLITEAATHRILDLYRHDFRIKLFKSYSLIAANKKWRRRVYEAVITNY